MMTSSGIYEKLESLQLSEFRLKQHSFPRPNPTTDGKAEISNAQNKYSQIPGPLSRNCRRCTTKYAVQEDGKVIKHEKCSYHPYRRNPGKPYRCCYKVTSTVPCKSAPQHVHGDMDMKNLTGFMMTKDNKNVTTKAAYAMDCEMIYTTGGMEVAVLSVVDTDCKVVYETKVIPDHPILDYNTEFSGLKASDFEGVTTTMKDVYGKFRTLFGPNTILIGHGLANDLILLRIIHDRVVDTLDVYPHKKGLPFLSSLQYLKDTYLSYDISSSGGFKCRGDAIAAMKLALRKT